MNVSIGLTYLLKRTRPAPFTKSARYPTILRSRGLCRVCPDSKSLFTYDINELRSMTCISSKCSAEVWQIQLIASLWEFCDNLSEDYLNWAIYWEILRESLSKALSELYVIDNQAPSFQKRIFCALSWSVLAILLQATNPLRLYLILLPLLLKSSALNKQSIVIIMGWRNLSFWCPDWAENARIARLP